MNELLFTEFFVENIGIIFQWIEWLYENLSSEQSVWSRNPINRFCVCVYIIL